MKHPLVSICTLAFNHEPYIRKCLDGFLMQKCDFDFEVLIHDDASTDNTANIIREYQEKYPDIIKPIYQTENQYSKGISVSNKYNFTRAKGKYIAMCEGDDYWTDPNKLQRQVDFLDANKDFIITCHRYTKVNKYGEFLETDPYEEIFRTNDIYTFDVHKYLERYVTKTCTIMFYKSAIESIHQKKYKLFRDKSLFFEILKQSNKKGALLNNIDAAYRVQEGGVVSTLQGIPLMKIHYKVNFEIFLKNQKLLNDSPMKSVLRKQNITLLKEYTKNCDRVKRIELLKNAYYLNPTLDYLKLIKNFI